MSNSTLVFNEATDTLRQMPENYLIAHKDDFKYSRWICEPDLAADRELCVKVFLALFEFENKYQKDGKVLLQAILYPKQKDKELVESKLKILKNYVQIMSKSNNPNKYLAVSFFIVLHNFLIIENRLYDDVVLGNKEINKHLIVEPLTDEKIVYLKFLELYNVYHNVRNHVETFDSVESVRRYLENNPHVYRKLM